MSDNIIALLIPVIMIAIAFAWVPLLNLICPPCRRSSTWRPLHDAASKTQSALLLRSRIHPADLAADTNAVMTIH
jgi:cytochrome c oxidase assembly protein Cox11